MGNDLGREHPTPFVSHRRVVEIWKGYTIPQPAVFFHRQVYEELGGLDEGLYFALDYDLFLRYTQRYRIMTVDRPWATYRLHATSKTTEITPGGTAAAFVADQPALLGNGGEPGLVALPALLLGYGGRLGIWSLHRLNLAERAWLGRDWGGFAGNLLLSLLAFPRRRSAVCCCPVAEVWPVNLLVLSPFYPWPLEQGARSASSTWSGNWPTTMR